MTEISLHFLCAHLDVDVRVGRLRDRAVRAQKQRAADARPVQASAVGRRAVEIARAVSSARDLARVVAAKQSGISLETMHD